MYKTTCPKCGANLTVEGNARFYEVPLLPDGFWMDDGGYDTYDEVAVCPECEWRAPLETLEEEEIVEHGGRLRCKNPKCEGYLDGFPRREAVFDRAIDGYLCPFCGGTDVGEDRSS